MYQFMVATTRSDASCGAGHATLNGATDQTVVDISTMSSLTSGTNKWASRAVVALQLAAWSAVGIVLLEKGVVSLQKSTGSISGSLRDSSMRQVSTTSSPLTRESSETIPDSDILSVIPLVTVNDLHPLTSTTNDLTSGKKDHATDDGTTSETLLSSPAWSRGTTMGISMIGKSNTRTVEDSNIMDVGPIETISEKSPIKPDREQIIDKNVQANPLNDIAQRQGHKDFSSNEGTKNAGASGTDDAAPKGAIGDGDKLYYDKDTKTSREGATRVAEEWDHTGKSMKNNAVFEDTAKEKENRDFEETEDESTRKWPTTINRKRLRIAEMSGGGGAAAAVAMVAVGAVMLVLGPAVIVLRALDERRQERRFLKLSSADDEDLPPSYDQATGSIEQAPTYSSLNLDTITSTVSSEQATSSNYSTIHRDPVELVNHTSRPSSLPLHSNQLLL